MFEDILAIDIEELIYFEDLFTLPYKPGGYDVIYQQDIYEPLKKIEALDIFLGANDQDNIYYESDLSYAVQSIMYEYDCKQLQMVNEVMVKIDQIAEFMIEVAIEIAPFGYTWQLQDGKYGLKIEKPSVIIEPDSQEEQKTVGDIHSSSIFTRLMYIYRNKEANSIRNYSADGLKNVCIDIVSKLHYVTFDQVKEETEKVGNAAQYLVDIDNSFIIDWIVEKLFFDEFKNDIEVRLLGSEITNLFQHVMSISYDVLSGFYIDGIDIDEIYSLREFCSECKSLDIDSDRFANRYCGCSDLEYLNNIYIIKDPYFFQELSKQGAMTYKTDSLSLYFQITHAGYYYDDQLRKAWLSWASRTVSQVIK